MPQGYDQDAVNGFRIDEATGEVVFTMLWVNLADPSDQQTYEYRVPYTSSAQVGGE